MFYIDSDIDFTNILEKRETQTPVVIYDSKQAEYTVSKLVCFFENYVNFKLSYALKASYNDFFLNLLSQYNFGCDVAGVEEYNVAKSKNFKFFTTTSPYYSDSDMKYFNKKNLVMDFNSVEKIVVKKKKEMEIHLKSGEIIG